MKKQNAAAVLSPLSSISSPPPTDTMTIEPGHIQPSPLPLPLSSSSLSPSLPQVLELINSKSIPSPPPSAVANEMDIDSPNARQQMSSSPPYAIGSATTTAPTNMTRDQIRYCCAIMRNLMKHRDATPFIHPVDYVKLNVPDYPQIIKAPMDLTTIDRKLRQKEYNDVNQFIADIRLVFNNCYKYNGPEATVSMLCQNVESAFEKGLRQMPLSKKVSALSTTDTTDGFSPPQAISPVFRRRSEANRPSSSKDHSNAAATSQQQKRRACGNSIGPHSIKRRKNDTRLKFCGQALRELKKNKYRLINYPFLYPVDVVALNIPDYHTIITHPMDISTIERNLTNNQYDSAEDFENDIRLMFNNCYRYNPPALPIHNMAKDLETVFDNKWKRLPERESTPPLPQPPAITPLHSSVITRKAYHYTSNSDDDDDDDDDNEEEDDDDGASDGDDRIAELERHIASISQQIASIKSTKKKSSTSTTGSKKASKKTPPIARKQKPTPTKSRRRSTSTPQRRQSSTTASSSSSQELPEFTFHQKKELSERINNLTGDGLNTVVSIIQSSMPNLDGVSHCFAGEENSKKKRNYIVFFFLIHNRVKTKLFWTLIYWTAKHFIDYMNLSLKRKATRKQNKATKPSTTIDDDMPYNNHSILAFMPQVKVEVRLDRNPKMVLALILNRQIHTHTHIPFLLHLHLPLYL
ncbi:Bromodomain-containing protein [Absidia repens]|uniref:Bromodomain-containing protein n=1 Tax=Absidia repens TaxID=90262 RepID=A0A1X2HYF1_9FUNG|nr:Bromodomain-containing protein [Absidia repens]